MCWVLKVVNWWTPKKAGVIQEYVVKGLFFGSEKLILRMGLEPAMQGVLFQISSELDF